MAKQDFETNGYLIPEGKLVAASPAVSNRIASDFADPDTFSPERYLEPRVEDRENPWSWIPFGAGRHRCVGAAFAMMQLKAIFSVLLRGWDFELSSRRSTATITPRWSFNSPNHALPSTDVGRNTNSQHECGNMNAAT